MTTYVFDQAWQRERERLGALEDLYDENSARRLAALGVADGWQCLEVGCGAGGLAHWLSTRVGPTGRVVATDLDIRFLAHHDRDNLEVWQHDIVTGPLDTDRYDLVHARAVLEHLPARDRVLARLVSAVRPGGWVVIEDVDFGTAMAAALARYCTPDDDFRRRFERAMRATEVLFRAAGADAAYGPRLPAVLSAAGLTDVGGQFYAPLVRGGTDRNWVRMTLEQLGGRLVGAGLLTRDEVDGVLAQTGDADRLYPPPVMVTAWGRRPAA